MHADFVELLREVCDVCGVDLEIAHLVDVSVEVDSSFARSVLESFCANIFVSLAAN